MQYFIDATYSVSLGIPWHAMPFSNSFNNLVLVLRMASCVMPASNGMEWMPFLHDFTLYGMIYIPHCYAVNEMMVCMSCHTVLSWLI